MRLGEVETNEFEEELRRLSEDGVDLVVVGAGVMGAGAAAALESRTGIIRFVGDLAYSVDFIDDIRPWLEELRAQIGLGKITVPTVPANTGDGASEEGA